MASSDLELSVLRSRSDMAGLTGFHDRVAFERAVAEAVRGKDTWGHPGYCQACGVASVLQGNWLYSDGELPNFRECLHCLRCGLNNRQRFVAGLIRARGARSVYLYEQVTPFYAWAVEQFPGAVGSEYLGPDIPSGSEVDGLRHEDALALSFADGSFDLMVSNDVFEHVPEIEPALRESVRVLRTEGRLVFSIPFYSGRDATVRRAELRNGEVVHLLPPDYHGNPVDAEGGSLVFYEHSWDILDRCKEAGFADAYVLGYWSALYGYLGEGLQLVFVAEAP